MSAQPITRDDIERSLRSIQAGVTNEVRSRKQMIVQGVTIGSVLFIIIVFLLGRRSGRKRNTIVEIRRV
jgi:hypothetical protein